MRKSAFHTQKSYSSCHKSVFFLTLCYNVGRPNEGLNIKLERWCIHMKKKICSFITRFGGTMAGLNNYASWPYGGNISYYELEEN